MIARLSLVSLAQAQEFRRLELADGRVLQAEILTTGATGLEIRIAQGRMLVPFEQVLQIVPSDAAAFTSAAPWRVLLVEGADGGFLALSSRCTHLGCSVPWDEKARTFPCPCHASTFDL